MSQKVRVLVVDDSALMRKLIPQALADDPNIEIVGTAMDGLIGLRKIEELHPHVVTLDLEMPRMDGLEMLRKITGKHRVPVIVVSAHTEEGASLTLKALSLGAFDFVTKPQDAALGRLRQIAFELALKIKVAASSGAPKLILTVPSVKRKEPRPFSTKPRWPSRIVAVGISTGGPNALQYLFSQLPEDFPGCLVVVQHMPEGFTEMFARRLDESSALEVKEAQSGDMLLAGRALICPGNRHIKVRRMEHGDVAILVDQPRVNGHRPSVDVLFHSVAQEFGDKSIAVLMTGMGEDGSAGLGAVQASGGFTIAQSPDTCIVDSMPRSAIARGFASRVVSLPALGAMLQAKCAVERPADEAVTASASKESAETGPSRRRTS
ncbi:MAG TPA: chemotaxis response regulator protein-glutamate methylesterase [Candidatus Baltobacteraceae bacterium]|jgi:two-component system, chemotaxis family, protein-glutamate methylesterase/glutaminase|nr:chemotaxis response regulator protein-glutamate methylesterase [Candidatus Baltobacteraceae bacterium]